MADIARHANADTRCQVQRLSLSAAKASSRAKNLLQQTTQKIFFSKSLSTYLPGAAA
jgi:hypothetical protein